MFAVRYFNVLIQKLLLVKKCINFKTLCCFGTKLHAKLRSLVVLVSIKHKENVITDNVIDRCLFSVAIIISNMIY